MINGLMATRRGFQQKENPWETGQRQILSTRYQFLWWEPGECHPLRLTQHGFWPLSCSQDGSCEGFTHDGVPGVFFCSDLNCTAVSENRPLQTAKLPPNCGTLVLIAIKFPRCRWFTPTRELWKPLITWEIPLFMVPILKAPTAAIHNAPGAGLACLLLHLDSTPSRSGPCFNTLLCSHSATDSSYRNDFWCPRKPICSCGSLLSVCSWSENEDVWTLDLASYDKSTA